MAVAGSPWPGAAPQKSMWGQSWAAGPRSHCSQDATLRVMVRLTDTHQLRYCIICGMGMGVAETPGEDKRKPKMPRV